MMIIRILSIKKPLIREVHRQGQISTIRQTKEESRQSDWCAAGFRKNTVQTLWTNSSL